MGELRLRAKDKYGNALKVGDRVKVDLKLAIPICVESSDGATQLMNLMPSENDALYVKSLNVDLGEFKSNEHICVSHHKDDENLHRKVNLIALPRTVEKIAYKSDINPEHLKPAQKKWETIVDQIKSIRNYVEGSCAYCEEFEEWRSGNMQKEACPLFIVCGACNSARVRQEEVLEEDEIGKCQFVVIDNALEGALDLSRVILNKINEDLKEREK